MMRPVRQHAENDDSEGVSGHGFFVARTAARGSSQSTQRAILGLKGVKEMLCCEGRCVISCPWSAAFEDLVVAVAHPSLRVCLLAVPAQCSSAFRSMFRGKHLPAPEIAR